MSMLEIAFVVLFGIGIWLSASFIRFARREHPDIWRDELGSVTMLSNNTIRTSLLGQRYILSRRWRSVPDRRFVTWCRVLFVAEILSFVFVGYVAVVVILSFTRP